MENNKLLTLKLNELEKEHKKEINKLIEKTNGLNELLDLNLKKANLIKNNNWNQIYNNGMNALFFSILATISFVLSMNILSVGFIFIDTIIFIKTIINSINTIVAISKNKKQRKEYKRIYNNIVEEMINLKYHYFRKRRTIEELYLKNNIVNNNISQEYKNNDYIDKECVKKLVKTKKREL